MGGIFGSGGSSGGGSSSSSLEPYIRTRHQAVLDALWNEIQTGENPYADINAFDVDQLTDAILNTLAEFAQEVVDFDNANLSVTPLAAGMAAQLAAITAFTPSTSWSGFLTTVLAALPDTGLSDTEIEDAVGHIGDMVKEELEESILPTFEGGMRDINAVNSSAFLLGEANLYGKVTKQIAEAAATYRLEAAKMGLERTKVAVASVDSLVNATLSKISAYGNYNGELTKIFLTGMSIKQAFTGMIVEAIKNVTTLKRDQWDEDNRLNVAEGRWYLDKYQYEGNMLGSVRGAVHSTAEGAQPANVSGSSLGGIMSLVGGVMGMIGGA